MKKLVKILMVFALGSLICIPGMAMALTFSDSFEGTALNPFWTVEYQDSGTIGLSSAQSHSGTQSLQLSSTSGGQRNLWLTHDFGEKMVGSVSVWFYDSAPGQQTLYSHLMMYDMSVSPTTLGFETFIGIMDYDASYYYAMTASSVIPPVPSVIARSVGWHKYEAVFGDAETKLYIDGTEVYSALGEYGLTRLSLQLSGPSWRPDATSYFDDFSANVRPVPLPPTALLLGTGLLGLAGWRRFRKS